MTSAEIFARHVLETPISALPASAVARAKAFVLDTLGVGVAGVAAPFADDVFRIAQGWGMALPGAGAARILARDVKLPASAAAYVNAYQTHCQEFDCVHEPAVVHPMATIFAGLLAATDTVARVVSGAEFLAAVILSVDVAASIGVAAKSPIRFFRPANAGVFATTLGVARVRKFSIDQARDALGHALAQCAGTMQAHVEGKPALPIQIAGAARAAVVACDLAERGVPGAHDVFEGPFGYFPLFEGEWDLSQVLAELGDVWRIEEVSHKPFPTGRAAQGGIVACQKLRDMGVRPEMIKQLTLTAPPLIKRLVGRPYQEGMGVNYARLCFPYIGARTLIDGAVGLVDFDRNRIDDASSAMLAARIEVADDGAYNPAAFAPQVARALLMDGAVVEARVDALYGSPQDPMDAAACETKFRNCLAYAGFNDGAASAALELLTRFDAVADARALLDLTDKH
ncbi:MAG: MmgE/PrpD family protein [Alphaproteobacteria bacterium]|nr:MmgE/PrpD family protein [Alphaproteobacteria bacterium]